MAGFFDQFEVPTLDPRLAQNREAIMAAILRESERPTQQHSIPAAMSSQQMQQKHQQLQNQQRLGQMMMASGDKALSPLGKTMAANDPNRWLQQQQRDEQNRAYMEGNLNRGKDRVSSLVKTLDAINDMDPNNNEHRYKVPASRINAMTEDAAQLRRLSTARDTLKASDGAFVQNVGKVIGLTGYAGPIEGFGRWLAQNMPALSDKLSPEMRQAAQWWADLDAFIIQPWRHGEFGATLTPNEQRAMDAMAMMKPGMDADGILDRLDNLITDRREGARERVTADIGLYGPYTINTYSSVYGDSLNEHGDRRSYDMREQEPPSGEPVSPDGAPDGFSIEYKSDSKGRKYREVE